MYSVLYLENDPACFAQTAKMISKLGYFLYVAESASEAKRIYKEVCPDITIIDLASSPELAVEIRKLNEKAQLIATFQQTQPGDMLSGIQFGFDQYLPKPAEYTLLSTVIEKCIENVKRDEKIRCLSAKNSLFQASLHKSPNMVLILDRNGKIKFSNSSACTYFGFNSHLNSDQCLSDAAKIQFGKRGIYDLIETVSLETTWQGEVEAIIHHGKKVVLSLSASKILSNSSPTTDESYVIHAEDVTVKKAGEIQIRKLNAELEYKVLKRTALLEAANRELDEFCDAISHELCGPLSRLQGLSKALCEDLKDKIDDTISDYVQRINQTSLQLKNILDALLNLSQLTRRGISMQDVNLTAITESVAQKLISSDPARQVRLFIAPEVIVKGDNVLLKVVMENLMMNAWKNTSGHALAQIEFGVAKSNEKSVYFVRDNGCGFDMKFASKLFKLFTKISSAGDTRDIGSGTELATAHRIIQRHGGRMWAEGEIEKGATFYFTL